MFENHIFIIKNFCKKTHEMIKKYAFTAMKYGVEYKDLYQEALVGFRDAIHSYHDDKNSSLATFITLCVDRRLQNAIRKAGRIKNQIFLESLSLDHVYDEYEMPLKEFISDDSKNDPHNTYLLNNSVKV